MSSKENKKRTYLSNKKPYDYEEDEIYNDNKITKSFKENYNKVLSSQHNFSLEFNNGKIKNEKKKTKEKDLKLIEESDTEEIINPYERFKDINDKRRERSNSSKSVYEQMNKLYKEESDNESNIEKSDNNNKDLNYSMMSSTNSVLSEDIDKVESITEEDFIAFNNDDNDDNFQNLFSIKDSNNDNFIPWMNDKIKNSNGYTKLHYEVLSFYELIKPTEIENLARIKTIDIIKNSIQEKFPLWKVKAFGSFPVNLHLPDSDIDLVIVPNNLLNEDSIFREIKQILIDNNICSYVNYIKAKVPIIKTNVVETGVDVDITINRTNGYRTIHDVKKITKALPCINKLIYVLKYFLRQRQLNDAYSGGVSSFLLFNLSYAYLNYHIKSAFNHLEENNHDFCYGKLLLGFFEFYGFKFRFDKIGISVRNGVYFYLRKDGDEPKRNILSVENYQELSQDVGKSAYKFSTVIECFKKARDNLKFPACVKDSYLDKVILIDKYLLKRSKDISNNQSI